MAETLHCQTCGTTLTPAVGGLCPGCVTRISVIPAEKAGDHSVSASGGIGLGAVGDYELLEVIAHGGVGVVFKARQRSLGRMVALKLLRSGQFARDEELKRFRAEAEAAAALEHPHIVPIYEVGESEGRAFLSMKLLSGGNLAQAVSKSRPSPEQCAQWVSKIARAVQFAHERGVLHRDLKPQNILIDEQGEPRVTDFGLAKRADSSGEMTLTGAILGSPSYMSPEAAAGQVKHLTTATDVYSLGAILYELITGRAPFRAETPLATLRQVMDNEPERPRNLNPDLDRDLEVICLKCLEKSAPRRYSSAAALADDLERFARGEPIHARLVPPTERAIKWIQRHPVRASAALAFLLVLVMGIGGVTWQWRRAEQRAEESRARLLRLHTLTGQRQLDDKDPLAALPWMAAALAGAPTDDSRREVYRAMLANAVRSIPLPEHIWFGRDGTTFALSPNGKKLAINEIGLRVRLFNTVTGELLVETKPKGSFGSIAFSPDNSRFALGGRHQVLICSSTNAEPLAPTMSQTGWVTRLAFSPDGRWLASRSVAGVRLWNALTGEAASPEIPHNNGMGLSFSSDGKLLATTDENSLRVWEVPTGRLMKMHPSNAWECAFSADDKWILVGRARKHALIFQADSLQPAGEVLAHEAGVNVVAFTTDSKRALTGSDDGAVRVWAVPGGKSLTPSMKLESLCQNAIFSPDGNLIATATEEGIARLWNAQTGQPFSPPLRHAGAVHPLAFSPDGNFLFTGSRDGAVRMWNLRASPRKSLPLSAHSESLYRAQFTPDGKRFVTRGQQVARVFNSTTGEAITPELQNGGSVDSAALSPDGSYLLTGGRKGQIHLWSVPSGSLLRTRPFKGFRPDFLWLPKTHRFVTLGERGEVELCSVDTNFSPRQLFPPESQTESLAASPDGTRFAIAASSPRFGLWTSNGDPVLATNYHVDVSAFSPDSVYLATGSRAGNLSLWRARDGHLHRSIQAHDGGIVALAFTRDSQKIATLSGDGYIRAWTAPEGKISGTPFRPLTGMRQIEWTSDGRWLATSGKRQAQLWDPNTSTRIASWTFERDVAGTALASAGRTFLAVTEDARIWHEPFDALKLTDAEWQLLSRALSSQEVDQTETAVPWRAVRTPDSLAEADVLTTRWRKIRATLREP